MNLRRLALSLLDIARVPLACSLLIRLAARHDNMQARRRYGIPDSFFLNGSGIRMYGPGRIICGEDGYIGRNSTLYSGLGMEIWIGRACRIGSGFSCYTNSHRARGYSLGNADSSGNIRIGAGCWLGNNVFVKEGVTIGEGSVVGANSAVVKDVPPFSFSAGCPAAVRGSTLGGEVQVMRE